MVSFGNIERKHWWIVFSLVLVWAIFLRLYGIQQESYWMDEGFSITIAKAIATHGYPLMDSGAELWRDPAYHYVLSIPVHFFGTGEIATRILSIFFGIVSIAIVTLIAKEWFSKQTAFFTFLLMSFSYWEIAWSRQARMYMMLQCVLWCTVWVGSRLFRSLQQKEKKWILWAGIYVVSTVLLLYTHRFGALVFAGIPLFFLAHAFFHRKKPLAWGALYIGVFLLTIVCVIVLVEWKETLPVPVFYWQHYSGFLLRHFSSTLVLAAIGIVIGLQNTLHREKVLWMSTFFLLGMAVFSFSVPLLHYRYIFFLYPVLFLCAAYALAWMFNKNRNGRIVTIAILFLLCISQEYVFLPRANFPLESDPASAPLSYHSITPQPQFAKAYEQIRKNNPSTIITPYPEMTALYLGTTDYRALYIDFIHREFTQPLQRTHLYTGTPYLTLHELQKLDEQDSTVVLLLDDFSRWRIAPDIRSYIDTHMTKILEEHSGEWSTVYLYTFQ